MSAFAGALAKVSSDKVLRFSQAVVPGRRGPCSGYRWSSIQTDSVETMQAMLALWNCRAEIVSMTDLLTKLRSLSEADITKALEGSYVEGKVKPDVALEVVNQVLDHVLGVDFIDLPRIKLGPVEE